MFAYCLLIHNLLGQYGQAVSCLFTFCFFVFVTVPVGLELRCRPRYVQINGTMYQWVPAALLELTQITAAQVAVDSEDERDGSTRDGSSPHSDFEENPLRLVATPPCQARLPAVVANGV